MGVAPQGHKETLVMMEMFCISTASLLKPCLYHCTTALQELWEKQKEYRIFLYYFLQVQVNYLKIKSSIKKKKVGAGSWPTEP